MDINHKTQLPLLLISVGQIPHIQHERQQSLSVGQKNLSIQVRREITQAGGMPTMDGIVLNESGTPPKSCSNQKQKAADVSETESIEWKMCLQLFNHTVKPATK
ncbi:hypothetical protein ACVZYT_002498 [Yersinia enterocolitica]